ncbi:MAG: hypothetical protein HYW48_07350 [Deltaproteobacteria bacterium]|nr:hypothetical protein [Deltaproteobacteria bacterium]
MFGSETQRVSQRDSLSKEWQPSLDFLDRGRCIEKLPGFSTPSQIRWSFQKGRNAFSFQLIQCTMSVEGLKSKGWGCHFLLKEALRIALAEAWERLLLSPYLKNSLPGLPLTHIGFAAGTNAEAAHESARRECLERYLLFQAARGRAELRRVSPRWGMETLIAWKIEKTWGPLSLFSIDGGVGRTFFAMVQTSQHWLCDSIFADASVFAPVRRLLYSIMGSGGGELRIHLPMLGAKSERGVCGGRVKRRLPRNSWRKQLRSFLPSTSLPQAASHCSSPVSELIYPGALMPAVAVAYISWQDERNAERLTQEEVFASLICQASQPH